MPPIIVVFHQTGAGHVEVVSGIVTVRGDLRDELEYECAIHACGVEYTELLDEFACLPALIANMNSFEVRSDKSTQDWHVVQELGPVVNDVST